MSSASWLWKILKGFCHIWAWGPSWSCDQDHLNKLSFPYPKGFKFNWPRGFRGEATDDEWTPDAAVIGILLGHSLAFVPSELKICEVRVLS